MKEQFVDNANCIRSPKPRLCPVPAVRCPGRVRCPLSAVRCPLPLSAALDCRFRCPLSFAVRYLLPCPGLLSAVRCPLSAVRCPLPWTVRCPLSAIRCPLSAALPLPLSAALSLSAAPTPHRRYQRPRTESATSIFDAPFFWHRFSHHRARIPPATSHESPPASSGKRD